MYEVNGDTNAAQNSFKDAQPKSLSLIDNNRGLSYKKTDKLVTALYMVTDIIDPVEPLRMKLRTLAVELLSDVTVLKVTPATEKKVQEILSLLDIAGTINLISVMNMDVLKKEFSELRKSVIEHCNRTSMYNGKSTISEFFIDEENVSISAPIITNVSDITNTVKAHPVRPNEPRHGAGTPSSPTRIGVQKGSTLMKAISDKLMSGQGMSSQTKEVKEKVRSAPSASQDSSSKKERRDIILNIIKNKPEGATITDIKNSAYGPLKLCGEKTLQRELVAMVSQGVLNKTGTKRWSRYFVS